MSSRSDSGGTFCRSSPPIVCSFSERVEDGSLDLPILGSATYDLGTWTFDADGNFEATP